MRKFEFTLDSGKKYCVKPPTLRQYNALLAAKHDGEMIAAVAAITGEYADYIINNWSVDDARRFVREFPTWVKNERESDPNS